MKKRARPKFARAFVDPASDHPGSDLAGLLLQAQQELAIQLPRLEELMKHYGIKPAHDTGEDPVIPWMWLALMLARQYEPNFKPVERVRPGPKLSSESVALVLEVDAMASERGVTPRRACHLLAEATGRDFKIVHADYYGRKKKFTEDPRVQWFYELWQRRLSENPSAARDLQAGIAALMAEILTGPPRQVITGVARVNRPPQDNR